MKPVSDFLKLLRLPAVGCLLAVSLFSCKDKKDTFVLDFQYDYAPMDVGHYVIYDVDSILYSYNGAQFRDSAHYQLKELVADTFYDNLNELNYTLELYRRETETSPWAFDRKWSIKRNTGTFQKKEDDINYIKLVFPPQQDVEWNGNIYVTVTDPFKDFLDWTYRYESVGTPLTINGLNFDSTVSVVAVSDSNALDKRLRKEVYAKGVGMIYQEWEILHAVSGVVFPNWQNDNLDGFRIRMKVSEHN